MGMPSAHVGLFTWLFLNSISYYLRYINIMYQNISIILVIQVLDAVFDRFLMKYFLGKNFYELNLIF